MLTRMILKKFKRFDEADIELGQNVVLIGPNNSGKTTALQALTVWQRGVKKWLEKRGDKPAPPKRPGVTLNRKDLIALPIPTTSMLWRDLHLREGSRENGKTRTENVRFSIDVQGVSSGKEWRCAFEFDYANEESFYCRPFLQEGGDQRMPVPPEAAAVNVAFLPAMSGLAPTEAKLTTGTIDVRIGEGRTAEVLRNLCYQVNEESPSDWKSIVGEIDRLFGAQLGLPKLIESRGEVVLDFRERRDIGLDISASGRGLQQTLLVLAYLQRKRGTVLLLDEPDAHLEVLRQQQIYELLTRHARDRGNQIIAASHSEVLLNEAAERDVVVAFVGQPHRINDRGTQLLKALKEIGFEYYAQAEQTGWIVYLEGSTDLAILRAFAERLEHPAVSLLERPLVHYVGNQPPKAEQHYFGLREAVPSLLGLALFDRLEKGPRTNEQLTMREWQRREIESYLCQPETLLAFAQSGESAGLPLFDERLARDMTESIRRLIPPVALDDRNDQWWKNEKVSESFLPRVFESFYRSRRLPNLMTKSNFHTLARFVPKELIDPEIVQVLDLIADTAARATPRT